TPFANALDLPKLNRTNGNNNVTAKGIYTDASAYKGSFDGEISNDTIDGLPDGTLNLIARTENKQLNITFKTTGFLGEQAQTITARVDLSNEKLPAVVESTISGADLTRIFKILLPETDVAVTGRATGTIRLSGNLMSENEQGEESLSLRGLTGTANFSELSVNIEDVPL